MLYIELMLLILISLTSFVIIYLVWDKIRKIYHNNYTFFDVLFMVLYPLEEILFLFLYYLDDPEKQGLWVSLIVVGIFLTVAVDKLLLKKQNEVAIRKCAEYQEKIIQFKNKTIVKLKNGLDEQIKEKEILLRHISKLKAKKLK